MKDFILKFKVNDYSMFNEFYKMTSKQVYFTALGVLKDHSLAEDILQDTYVTFLNNIDNVKENQNIYAYLTMIARNKSLNLLKENKRLVFDEDIMRNITYQTDKNQYSDVDQILSYLDSQEDREIIIYHVLLDYKFKDIAKIIKKPLGTVLWKYNKAMKYLKERIGEIYE
ncbi:MAG: RNA polymerase sigma factor [Erysipelotrichaceae bacterium]|nr:RNA polymerase sigma factor [Erysipelotrichaceae bacterium]